MGGSIPSQSEHGMESSLRVAEKLSYAAIGGMIAPPWYNALAGVRVMIVEPHPATRTMLAEIVTAHGMVPETYPTVADALQPSIREAFSCVIIDAAVLASTPWISPVPVVQIVSPT